MKTEYKVLAALIVIGAVLRFWNIGFQHMNADEIWTTNFAAPAMNTFQVIIHALSTDCNPPLYYIFANWSMILFGQTATAIRIPSAIAGVLLIPVVFLVGREYKDELFGLLLAGFTTISYSFIFYSKYGRSYSLELLLFTIAFLYFMRLVKGDKRASFPFAVFILLCFWTHLYSVIPLGVMVLYLIWTKKISLPTLAVPVIGSLPLLNYVILITTTRALSNGNFGEPPLAVLFYTPIDLFNYSVVIVFPIIVWMLWKHRDELLFRLITGISLVTWISMVILSTRTPIVLHYSLVAVPMLLIPFILPFWEAIHTRSVYFHHFVVLMVVTILEATQIVALATIQRGSW